MRSTIYILFLFIYSLNLSAELITQNVIQKASQKYNVRAKNRLNAVKNSLLLQLQNQSEIKQINTVNTWMNNIQYKSDKTVYGVSDYWATLYEFVAKGMGDCEDYTIAKYYVLKELGVDPKRLKFTYVIYKNRRGKHISHMVLAYLTKAKPTSKDDILILDNTNRLVLPASKRTNIIRVIKMINGDTGPKSKKWKKLEAAMKRKKL